MVILEKQTEHQTVKSLQDLEKSAISLINSIVGIISSESINTEESLKVKEMNQITGWLKTTTQMISITRVLKERIKIREQDKIIEDTVQKTGNLFGEQDKIIEDTVQKTGNFFGDLNKKSEN